MGAESAWDFLGRKNGGRDQSIHELVEMAYDGNTPKRIRDGQFVFIDEETCIGCTQVSAIRLFHSCIPISSVGCCIGRGNNYIAMCLSKSFIPVYMF